MNAVGEPGGRKRRGVKNLIYGLTAQALIAVMNLALRSVIISKLGLNYVALGALFNEIIAMMSLAELGIGSAITFSLYKPLAKGDEEKCAQIMTLFQRAYRIIAAVILGVGCALTPFVHLLVKDIGFDLPYIRLVFLLYTVKTASSYLFSYKAALLTADQRMYEVTRVNTAATVAMVACSILEIVVFGNFIVYLLLQIAFSLGGNYVLSRLAQKRYPLLARRAELPASERKAIFKNVRSVFVGKLSGRITNSTDNILITLLVDTLSIGLYANYSMVLTVLTGVVTQIESAISAGVGNLLAVDYDAYAEETLRRLTFSMAALGTMCMIGLMCVFSPFVSVWIGEKYTLGDGVVFVLCLNLFLQFARMPLWTTVTGAGLFQKDKYISIIGSTANLVVSVLLGRAYGMIGIFIGTTCTHVIQIVLKTLLLYRQRLHASPARYYLRWLFYTLWASALTLAAYAVCRLLPAGNAYLRLLLSFAVGAAFAGLSFLPMCRMPEFAYFKAQARELVRKLRHR